jgi:mercuric ion transport protein
MSPRKLGAAGGADGGRWREVLTGALPVAALGTLVCCALPITLVALGAGSAVAWLVVNTPWLVTLSAHKEWIFLGVGVLLALDYWALFRSRAPRCRPGGVCHPSHPVGRWLRRLFWA